MMKNDSKAKLIWLSTLSALVGVLLMVASGYGLTRFVPSEYATIQSAVDASQDADTIAIGPGTYETSVNLRHKSLTIIGTGGPDSTRLVPIVGQSFFGFPLAPKLSVMDGIHFDQFQTVLFATAPIMIRNCRITRPIGLFPSTTSISFMSSTKIDNCRFDGIAGSAVNGSLSNGTSLEIQNCSFDLDPSDTELEFWMIRVGVGESDTASVKICRNLIVGDGFVDAIGIKKGLSGEITRNTIVECRRGIQVDIQSRVRITNNIVAYCPEIGTASWMSPLDFNNFWRNGIDYYQGIPAGPHDITADPLFVDPANGDYSLMCNSPCIDMGDPTSEGFSGKRIDIGAFEYKYVVGNATASYGDNAINISDIVFLINYIFIGGAAPCPVGAGMTDCDDAITILDAVHLVSYLFANGAPPCVDNR